MNIKLENGHNGFIIYLSDDKDFIKHISWEATGIVINEKAKEIIESSLSVLFNQYLREIKNA